MKIILTHEVSGLGAAGDVVDVKDGYARNYLVPRGFAIRWTKGGEKDVDPIRRPARSARSRPSSRPTRSRPSSRPSRCRCRRRAGDAGRLFGSVTPADIAEAVKAAGGPDVDKRRDRARFADQDPGLAPGVRASAPRGCRDAGRRGRSPRRVTLRFRLGVVRRAVPSWGTSPSAVRSQRVSRETAGFT